MCVCWKRTFLHRSLIVKSKHSRIELVTRPGARQQETPLQVETKQSYSVIPVGCITIATSVHPSYPSPNSTQTRMSEVSFGCRRLSWFFPQEERSANPSKKWGRWKKCFSTDSRKFVTRSWLHCARPSSTTPKTEIGIVTDAFLFTIVNGIEVGTVVWHKHWPLWRIFFAWNKMFVQFIVAKP